MKVLVSAFQCGPGMGSEPGNGWYWPTSLADSGHEVTVLTRYEWRERILAEGRTDIDFHFVDAPPSRFTAESGALVYNLYRRWQDTIYEHEKALQSKYDVVHHVAWGSLHLGSRLWRLPAPLVYGPIGGGQTAPGNYRSYFGRRWPMELMRNATVGPIMQFNGWTRETLRNAAAVLVTNSATEAAARRLGATDVRYFLAEGLPPGWIGEPRQRPTGVPTVLWVGRMLPRKAPVLAVEAFAELRRTMPARLVMAGDGPLLEQVRATVARLGIADDVELMGKVPWSTVNQLCESSSVFLFSSLRDSSGSQFLEAMGKGLPAVALDLHGIGDVKVGIAAEKVALTERPEDLHLRMADALRTVLTGDDWAARSAAGITWATKHVWPAKAAAATQIYEEVTSGGR
jgi:glycosyltransferase involved in cell wall biosynthesis